MIDILELPIDEEWLREVGFKWHQLERQPEKQWLLWLGDVNDKLSCYEDLGIELSKTDWPTPRFNCWLRSDVAHRYSRCLHVRRIETRAELIALIEALTNQKWNPVNHIYGTVHRPNVAERLRKEHERIDLKMMRYCHPWRVIEKDESRGQALPEHYEAHEKAKGS